MLHNLSASPQPAESGRRGVFDDRRDRGRRWTDRHDAGRRVEAARGACGACWRRMPSRRRSFVRSVCTRAVSKSWTSAACSTASSRSGASTRVDGFFAGIPKPAPERLDTAHAVRARHPTTRHRPAAQRARHRARGRDPARRRSGRARSARRRGHGRSGRRHTAAGALPRRLRRRPQHRAQAARRRVSR